MASVVQGTKAIHPFLALGLAGPRPNI